MTEKSAIRPRRVLSTSSRWRPAWTARPAPAEAVAMRKWLPSTVASRNITRAPPPAIVRSLLVTGSAAPFNDATTTMPVGLMTWNRTRPPLRPPIDCSARRWVARRSGPVCAAGALVSLTASVTRRATRRASADRLLSTSVRSRREMSTVPRTAQAMTATAEVSAAAVRESSPERARAKQPKARLRRHGTVSRRTYPTPRTVSIRRGSPPSSVLRRR